MDKKDLQKNILDLRYHFESQKINAILVICTVGILTFLGTFIWYRERIIFGIALSVFIIMISVIFYLRTRNKMNEILSHINNLKE